MNRTSLALATIVALSIPATFGALHAQEGYGRVAGRVVQTETGAGLTGAQVVVSGTSIGAVTDENGRYLLPRVPAGSQTVEATYLGRVTGSETVNVPAGQTATADVAEAAGELAILGARPLQHNAYKIPLMRNLVRRAIRTSEIALHITDRHWIPVKRHWRLNERHYGALQGKDKKQTLEAYGEEQFMLWRRSYDVPPPPIEDGSEFSQAGDARYADLPPELLPKAECLKDVLVRALPYWYDAIVPDLRAGKTVLVAAHGNSLRAIVKHLDQVSDEAIAKLNIPTGIPLRYDLDENLRPITAGGTYLDPQAAKEAAAAVANQGR